MFEIAQGPLLSSKFFSHSELGWWLILLWKCFYIDPYSSQTTPKFPFWAPSFPFPATIDFWVVFFFSQYFLLQYILLIWQLLHKDVGEGLISLLSPSILTNVTVCFCVSAFEAILKLLFGIFIIRMSTLPLRWLALMKYSMELTLYCPIRTVKVVFFSTCSVHIILLLQDLSRNFCCSSMPHCFSLWAHFTYTISTSHLNP